MKKLAMSILSTFFAFQFISCPLKYLPHDWMNNYCSVVRTTQFLIHLYQGFPSDGKNADKVETHAVSGSSKTADVVTQESMLGKVMDAKPLVIAMNAPILDGETFKVVRIQSQQIKLQTAEIRKCIFELNRKNLELNRKTAELLKQNRKDTKLIFIKTIVS